MSRIHAASKTAQSRKSKAPAPAAPPQRRARSGGRPGYRAQAATLSPRTNPYKTTRATMDAYFVRRMERYRKNPNYQRNSAFVRVCIQETQKHFGSVAAGYRPPAGYGKSPAAQATAPRPTKGPRAPAGTLLIPSHRVRRSGHDGIDQSVAKMLGRPLEEQPPVLWTGDKPIHSKAMEATWAKRDAAQQAGGGGGQQHQSEIASRHDFDYRGNGGLGSKEMEKHIGRKASLGVARDTSPTQTGPLVVPTPDGKTQTVSRAQWQHFCGDVSTGIQSRLNQLVSEIELQVEIRLRMGDRSDTVYAEDQESCTGVKACTEKGAKRALRAGKHAVTDVMGGAVRKLGGVDRAALQKIAPKMRRDIAKASQKARSAINPAFLALALNDAVGAYEGAVNQLSKFDISLYKGAVRTITGTLIVAALASAWVIKTAAGVAATEGSVALGVKGVTWTLSPSAANAVIYGVGGLTQVGVKHGIQNPMLGEKFRGKALAADLVGVVITVAGKRYIEPLFAKHLGPRLAQQMSSHPARLAMMEKVTGKIGTEAVQAWGKTLGSKLGGLAVDAIKKGSAVAIDDQKKLSDAAYEWSVAALFAAADLGRKQAPESPASPQFAPNLGRTIKQTGASDATKETFKQGKKHTEAMRARVSRTAKRTPIDSDDIYADL